MPEIFVYAPFPLDGALPPDHERQVVVTTEPLLTRIGPQDTPQNVLSPIPNHMSLVDAEGPVAKISWPEQASGNRNPTRVEFKTADLGHWVFTSDGGHMGEFQEIGGQGRRGTCLPVAVPPVYPPPSLTISNKEYIQNPWLVARID